MKRILPLAAALAVALTLSACTWGTRYEAWGWADNNCSGNGGIHDANFCAGYTKGMSK